MMDPSLVNTMSQETHSAHTLFFSLPFSKETLTIRDIESSVCVETLVAKLELLSGLAAHIVTLHYGGRCLDTNDRLQFEKDVRNGSLIKVEVGADYCDLVRLVCEGKDEEVLRRLSDEQEGDEAHRSSSGDEEDEEERVRSSGDGGFVVAFLCCREGNLNVLQRTLTAELAKKRSVFGRTLTHVAAAHDQAPLIKYLTSRFQLDLFLNDAFSKNTHDIAVEFSSSITEIFLRNRLSQHRRSPARKSPRRHLQQTRDQDEAPMSRSQHGCDAPATNRNSYRYLTAKGEVLASSADGKSQTVNHQRKTYKAEVYDTKKGIILTKISTRKDRSQYPPQTHISLSRDSACVNQSTGKSRPSTSRRPHRHCTQQKPFLAYHPVSAEELKPVSVEYVPLERRALSRVETSDARPSTANPVFIPTAPCSSLNSSLEDLHSAQDEPVSDKRKLIEERKRVFERYNKAQGTTYRVQSAKYHRTQYHLAAEEDHSLPKPRPKTAGPRYREWKTWMSEKLKRDEERGKLENERSEKRRENIKAFEKWLSKKDKFHGTRYVTDSDSSDNESNYYENRKAYDRWTDQKKKTGFFKKQDKKRIETLINKENQHNTGESNLASRRVTIYEIGNTDPTPLPHADPHAYMRAYQDWLGRKEEFEAWCKKKGVSRPDGSRMEYKDLLQMRTTLILDGMTYEEWLGQKERESFARRTDSVKS